MNNVSALIKAAESLGANHIGEYPVGSYTPMNNTVGTLHAVEDLKRIEILALENLKLVAQVEQLKQDIDIGAKDYCGLMERHDALFVKVDQLRDLLIRAVKGEQYIIESDLIAAIGSDLQSEISEAIDATPAQCLQEIQADAYWKGYVAGGDDFRSRIKIPLEVVTKKASELIVKLYPDSESAKKIRQQAKGE